jgi:hypothetical protein
MAVTFWICVAAFTLLFVLLFRAKIRLLDMEDDIDRTRQKVEEMPVSDKGASL